MRDDDRKAPPDVRPAPPGEVPNLERLFVAARQGSLANESGFQLFALVAASRATGRLTLTFQGRSFALTFRRGGVEHVASSDPQDGVGPFLVRKGAIGSDALARAEARRSATGGDLVSALISERLVNPAEIAGFLQEHGAQLAQRALAVQEGSWAWDPQATAPSGAFPLGPPFAMLCAAARSLDAATLVRRLGGRERCAAARVASRLSMEVLRLNPQETRAVALFDGSRSPAEIAAANPRDELVVLRLAFLLGELDLLEFAAAREDAPRSSVPPASARPTVAAAIPPARPPAAPVTTNTAASPQRNPVAPARRSAVASLGPAQRNVAPAKSPAGPGAKARTAPVPKPAVVPASGAVAAAPKLDAASLESLYAKLAGADHFTVLGVKQDAPASQIKIAYFQLAKRYHPDAMPPDAPQEVKKLCADVFAKVSEAWAILGGDASRAAYIERLRSGGTSEVDVKSIFDAENSFRAGTMLVKARKYAEAIGRFEEAIKLNPDEAEFGMWKTWCEFLLSADKKRMIVSAASAIEAALKRNPRCATGYLFLGQMAKLVGDLSLAEKQLRRGLEVAPSDSDLQRELRYLRR